MIQKNQSTVLLIELMDSMMTIQLYFFVKIFVTIPFPERKGYTTVKKCLKIVILSKPIRNELLYFKALRSFDQTIAQLIEDQESFNGNER
jgi:hypothetical protein